jgi:sugar/nucleoside kinase (ribokinase family)
VEEGVSTKLMTVLDRPLPSLSVCMTHAGDRGFLTYDVPHVDPGESCAVNVLLAVEQEEAPFLLCYLTSSVAAYAPIARRRGMTIVADCGWDEAWLTSSEIRTLFPLTDILFANEPEACAITGESNSRAALRALARQVPFVVVKQGPAGASASVNGREYHVPTEPVDVVDATGAGDCFNACFLYGLNAGRAVEECLQLGNICGGLAVRVPGGYAGAPTEKQLMELFSRASHAGSDAPEGSSSNSSSATPARNQAADGGESSGQETIAGLQTRTTHE